jgi:hypothetical protein
MSFESKIQHIQDVCRKNPSSCYLGWRGIDPVDGHLYKIYMVFGYVVFMYKDIVRARKIAGTSSWFTNGDFKIVFSTDLLRIRGGNRDKKVILPDHQMMDEKAYPSGLVKNVELGVLPYQLTEGRKTDVDLVNILTSIVDTPEKIVTDKIEKPVFYLAAFDKEAFEPRLNPELTSILRNQPAYSEKCSLQENFGKCFERCFEKKSNNRWFINYEWVKGKGIPFVDLGSVHPAYDIRALPHGLDCEDEYFMFRLSGSLK